jgi:glycosyltransferase involved in cell wall biosynthesis
VITRHGFCSTFLSGWKNTLLNKMNNNPMITVLMAVHNGEKYLKEAVDSILVQTYSDLEFIIIDDASTDKTKDILNSFIDKRIRIINNDQNIGLTKSLNKGLLESKGEYIARMDADDISLPERLEMQKKFLDANKDVVCLGGMTEIVDNNNNRTGQKRVLTNADEIRFRLVLANQIAHPASMFRKDVIKSVGNYNEHFKYVQDFELWSRLSSLGYKISNLDRILIKYRFHKQSITQNDRTRDKAYEFVIQIIQNNISRYITTNRNEVEIFLRSFHKHRVQNIKELLTILKILSGIQKSYIEMESPNELIKEKIIKYIRAEKIKALRWYATVKYKTYIQIIKRIPKQ